MFIVSFGEIGVKMKSQKCIKCNHEFTYKEKFFTCLTHNFVLCKICGAKYRTTFTSKLLLSLLFIGLVLLERPICKFHEVPLIAFILLYLVILFLLYPVFARFNIKPITEQIENKDQKES